MMKLTVRFRIDISPSCSLGPGKITLLETIERVGSLNEAARTLGMSYRRAWFPPLSGARTYHPPRSSALTSLLRAQELSSLVRRPLVVIRKNEPRLERLPFRVLP